MEMLPRSSLYEFLLEQYQDQNVQRPDNANIHTGMQRILQDLLWHTNAGPCGVSA
jgi:hypothetical protein